ncbi:MAG TPA: LamG domain-containing protein [Polyangia bacterium]
MGMVSGCTQLLGVADITGQDGAVNVMSGSDGGNDGSPGVDVPFGSADSGPASDGGDAGTCVDDLSYAYMAGFYISFTMQTRQPDGVIALLNQRDKCALETFWDLQLVKHVLYFEMADPVLGDADVISTGAPLNDDVPHDILITRDKNGLVQLKIGGVLSGTATLHQSLSGQLPILQIGTSVCVGEDPNVQFHGTISNVCVRLQ